MEVSRGGGIAITTRTGERLAMPRTDSLQVASVVPALSQLDCELIRPWRALIVFDVLRLADRDMARTALSERLMRLGALSLDGSKLGSVRTVRCGNVDEVDEFYNGVLAGGGEGIVLKRLEDPYPAKGVVWLKTKPGL